MASYRHLIKAATAACLFLFLCAASVSPCTLAVVAGKATPDGRPLLWKNRDTTSFRNKMIAFAGERLKGVALIDAEDSEGKEIWAGLNEAGLALMNSQADDLGGPGKDGADNGRFIRMALGRCATAAEFEALLKSTAGTYDLTANFGVIDAEGAACFFETGPASYRKFDARDPAVAPFGYIVRTNYAFTSPDPLRGGGFIRFERASHLFQAARGENRLTVRFILQEAARDLVHEKLHSYPLAAALPADPAAPLYIHTNDTINRNSSVAVAVFQGAPSKDKAYLATMWAALGQPVTAVATPFWPGAGSVPSVAAGPDTAPLNDFSRALVAFLYPDVRGRMPQYLNLIRLRTCGGEGILPKLLRVEDAVLERTARKLREWEARRPDAQAVAAFQEEQAKAAYESLRAAFPNILVKE
ncbi:MAG: hypothetical protein JW742_03170 [Candidatus Aminicenantes bacterium]|nr:hypothetical protein [Candidatus Aminicenantes bacterium]